MGTYRQAFFRVGRPILEVVEAADMEPRAARFWGITFTTADIDAAAELLGDKLGRVKDAVQPGRRIATVRQRGRTRPAGCADQPEGLGGEVAQHAFGELDRLARLVELELRAEAGARLLHAHRDGRAPR